MKVALIGPVHPYRGGIAHHSALLAKALTLSDHKVHVISFARQFPSWLYPGVSDKDPSQQPLKTPAEFILDPIFPWTWKRVIGRIRELDPDLILFQWWTTFWAIPYRIICSQLVRHGYRVVFIIHNVLPHEEKNWDRQLAKLGLGGSHGYVVQNPSEGKRLKKLLPEANFSICKIPVYPPFVDMITNQTEARSRLDLPEKDSPILLFFGIVREYKGLEILLNALSRLTGINQKPLLLIAGEFWESKTEYLNLIEQLGLKDRVYIHDRYIPNEEVGLYFNAADILVAPYLAGTQSAVAGLALSYGLPMVVTDTIAEGIHLTGNENVRIVPAGDPDSLASAIAEMIRDLPVTSRIPVSAEADWERMVRTIETLAQ